MKYFVKIFCIISEMYHNIKLYLYVKINIFFISFINKYYIFFSQDFIFISILILSFLAIVSIQVNFIGFENVHIDCKF